MYPIAPNNEFLQSSATDLRLDHFERQAVRTPEAIAITCADKQLIYRELDQHQDDFKVPNLIRAEMMD